MADLNAEIEIVLHQAAEIWNSQDYGRLKELWDNDDPEPFYLAEEQHDWVFGWKQLEKYWEPVPGKRSIEAIMMRYYDVHAKLIAPDLALAAFWVRHDMKMRGPMKPWGGDARVSAVFRRKHGDWRFVSYAEACMTPLLYIQKLYEMNLSPEFTDFHTDILTQGN
jgi:hypothetical protein